MTVPVALAVSVPLPLVYRSKEFDDWGMIRDAEGCPALVVRYPRATEEDLNSHRIAKTDPAQDFGEFVVKAVNAYETLTAEVARLRSTLRDIATEGLNAGCKRLWNSLEMAGHAEAALGEGVGGEEGSRGVAMIAAERQRQVEKEGWTADHDDKHWRGDMAEAAAAYALNTVSWSETAAKVWPWADEWWKPKTRVQDLTRAGALIAAEIDRLYRKEAKRSASERWEEALQSPEADERWSPADIDAPPAPESGGKGEEVSDA